MTVDANEIDVFLENENLAARVDVRTVSTRTSGESRPSGSLFTDDAPVYGTAADFQYVKETGKATYTGTARVPAHVKQDKTDIAAVKIDFTESTNNLQASGQVDSTIQMTPASSASSTKTPAKLENYRVRSETLNYDDAKRVAVYVGPLVSLTTDDGDKIEARRQSFELAKDSRTLQLMRAEGDKGENGKVIGFLAGGYEVSGDVLIYRADSDLYSLTGKPAIVKSPNDGTAESKGQCKFTVSTNLNLNKTTGAVEFPGTGQAPQNTDLRPCTTPIRTIIK
jgi:hypothetical protein